VPLDSINKLRPKQRDFCAAYAAANVNVFDIRLVQDEQLSKLPPLQMYSAHVPADSVTPKNNKPPEEIALLGR
jgi:hypothetical protein